MKSIALLFLIPSLAFAQAAATQSQAEAVQRYPSLTEVGSKLNKRFVARVNELRAASDSLLSRDDWPLVVASQVAEELKIKPAVQAAAVDAQPARIQPRGTALDRAEPSSRLGSEATAAVPRDVVSATVKQVGANSFTLNGRTVEMTWDAGKPTIEEVAAGVYRVGFSVGVYGEATQAQAAALETASGKVYVIVTKDKDSYYVKVKLLGNSVQSNGSQLRPESHFIWK